MKAAVIVFPGSNCDRDAAVALEAAMGRAPVMVWHGDAELPASDLIVLPGGFSYGDYLRSGAMAAHSPIMREVIKRAKAGTPVLGICNGFQVLTEARLLPGVLDPQGKAIEGALHALGFGGVEGVRQGKYIEVEVAEKDPARARAEVERMCKELLANTIVENYAYELEAA